MTTLLGFQGDGFVVICGDSRVSVVSDDSTSMQTTLASSHSKLTTNGRYVIAAAGAMRALNLLQYCFSPPQPPATLKGKKLDVFVTTKFIPALRECFESNGFVSAGEKDVKGVAQHDAELLVSINSTIYKVDSDYGWGSDATGLYAAGTGGAYGLGALHALLPAKEPTVNQVSKCMLRAMSIAARLDPYTGAPYRTLIQQT